MDERSGSDRRADDADPAADARSREAPDGRSTDQPGGRFPRVPDAERSATGTEFGFDSAGLEDRSEEQLRSTGNGTGTLDESTDRIPVDPALDLDGSGDSGSPAEPTDSRETDAPSRRSGVSVTDHGDDPPGWGDGVGVGTDPSSVRFWAALLSGLGVISFLVAAGILWTGTATVVSVPAVDLGVVGTDATQFTLVNVAAVGAALLGVAFLAAGVLGLRTYPRLLEHLAAGWVEHRRYVHGTVGLFVLGIVAGAIAAAAGYDVLEMIAEAVGEHPFEGIEEEDLTAAWFIRNNSVPFLLAIAGVVTLGFLTLYILVFNGIIVGNVAWFVASTDGVGVLFVGLAPHGVFELTAIFVAAGVGFRLLHRLGQRVLGDREAFVSKPYLLRTALLVAFAWLLLALAAFVEAHVTGLLLEHLVVA